MTTFYLKKGNTYTPTDSNAVDIRERLPAGNYIVQEDMFKNLYLEQIDSFTFTGKRYGDNEKNTDRIMRTFLDRPAATGVMLTGEKGSGKSLLAKSISMRGYELDIPTLVINRPVGGDVFAKFIQDIEQPCIILFDEFEKVFDRDDQEAILTLLDGVFPSKKLFVMTCNDSYRVDSHMKNRPGRIYYMLEFFGLSHEFIIEYCQDNLNNKQYIDQVCKVAGLFDQFNFDMLKALVEEMNRYNESPQDAVQMLNAKPNLGSSSDFSVELVVDQQPIDKDRLVDSTWNGNPLMGTIRIDVDTDPDNRDCPYTEHVFKNTDLTELAPANGKFTFVNNKGDKMILTRIKETQFDYFRAV